MKSYNFALTKKKKQAHYAIDLAKSRVKEKILHRPTFKMLLFYHAA